MIKTETVYIDLGTLHPKQEEIRNSTTRFKVADCGRRFGKTTVGIDMLADEETITLEQGWFSPTYKSLLEVWREAESVFRPIITRRNIQERRFELATGGIIEFWSLDKPDVARGRKYRRIVVDEAAQVPRLLDVFHEVLRPTLADYEGDALFLSCRHRSGQ